MKKGQRVKVFLDWQSQKKFMGQARLIQFVEEGLSFILEEGEWFTIYGGERWLVEFLDGSYPKGFRKNFTLRKELYKGNDPKMISKFTTYSRYEIQDELGFKGVELDDIPDYTTEEFDDFGDLE